MTSVTLRLEWEMFFQMRKELSYSSITVNAREHLTKTYSLWGLTYLRKTGKQRIDLYPVRSNIQCPRWDTLSASIYKDINNHVIFILFCSDEVLTLSGFDTSGAAGRAEGTGSVLCCEGSEEGCGSHGWWCGVYHGREESPGPRLGEPLPHTPLLHIPV